MKFIVDAQLPPALAAWLRGRGYEAHAVREIGLRDADDRAIWSAAERQGAVIVTKDEDFALLAANDLDGLQVLWVRTGNVINRELLARLSAAWPEVEAHLGTTTRVVEVR